MGPNEPPSTLPAYYSQHLDWQPCDNGFQCARLLVPFDYAHPGGRRFSLPVIKLPATDPARRVAPLVINPGGPGGSGVQYALAARSEFPAALRARFDIVGFDPRGVDRPWPRSLAVWQAQAAAAGRAAPLFGPPNVWGNLPCAYWPVPPAPLPRITAAGAPPILVVGTTRDPATPYRWARALAADLPSGVLLGRNGDGHTAYGEGSVCVDTIVNAYLISLKVPRGGTVCP